PERYRAFLASVIDKQAELIAQWQCLGFVHGGMNTDNMALSGETIDYGPCAFMDRYHPATVFSSIDHYGRYAYGNQPAIGAWNLARFAEALLPLLADQEKQAIAIAEAELAQYGQLFDQKYSQKLFAKVGIFHPTENDVPLLQELFQWLQQCQADFTNTFRRLAFVLDAGANPNTHPDTFFAGTDKLFAEAGFQAWCARWQERLSQQDLSRIEIAQRMRAINLAVIPRNHKVEEALRAATNDGNLAPFHELLRQVRSPFVETPENQSFREPAPPGPPYRTFCGT
ncbi:MAG: protein adenylyltransferase SelO family protein, partial [Turneriella sp.]|nr:protein adenylyltransferase SelO family protein [Turneriella sp.]